MLETVFGTDRPFVYSKAENPQDALLERAWIDLLASIGIDNAIAQAPLAKEKARAKS